MNFLVDTYAHVRSFSAKKAGLTSHSILNELIDSAMLELRRPRIQTAYRRYQNFVNLRDNLGMGSKITPVSKFLSRTIMLTNLPFSGTMTEDDLIDSMKGNEVRHCVLVNLEPFSSALDTLAIRARYPDRFSAAVNLIADNPHYSFEERFQEVIRLGAKGLAIHPILERLEASSEHYDRCASLCSEAGIPLICRTGVTYYSDEHDPRAAEVRNYEKLIAAHPKTRFVLTHSNLADYEHAIEIARKYPNTWLDTAWQTVASLKEIIASVGADRVMFASDWPVLGDQQRTQRRILSKLRLSSADFEKVARKNATELYQLPLS